MDEAAGSFVAAREDLGIAIPDLAHLFFGDPGVMQRRAPVGGALENGQLADFLGDGLDGLHGGRPGADHRDPLAFEVHRFLRPEGGVAGLTLERVESRDARHGRRREDADGGDQEACVVAPAILQHDLPASRLLAVVCGADTAAELDITAQVELVGDVVQIALGLGCRREVFFPIPFLQQLVGKRVAVGPAFGIEARTGVAVPVPGAADIAAVLEHQRLQTEFAQLVELIETGNAGTDDDSVKIQGRIGLGLVRRSL